VSVQECSQKVRSRDRAMVAGSGQLGRADGAAAPEGPPSLGRKTMYITAYHSYSILPYQYIVHAKCQSILDYKKGDRKVGMEKGGEEPRGQEGHGIQGTAKGSPTLCANLADETQDNTRNSHATLKTQRLEATSTASRAARGSTGTLAASGTSEECRGRRRYTNKGRSGLPTVRSDGQPAQDAVCVSDKDGERSLSAPRGS
jgi:hypothetical protein